MMFTVFLALRLLAAAWSDTSRKRLRRTVLRRRFRLVPILPVAGILGKTGTLARIKAPNDANARRQQMTSIAIDRRDFLAGAASVTATAALGTSVSAQENSPDGAKPKARRRNRFAVSTYSFWQFRHKDLRDIETCIDLAADMGFDGVEFLHRQMENEANDYLQRLKRRAFLNGLDLCGFSTHQTFLSPDAAVRQKNVEHTVHCIELAYQLGIPTMRVNT